MQSDLHATLEKFLLVDLAMELGNIRAGLAFLAPCTGDRAVADLGAMRVDLQLSRLEDSARRISRLLREDGERSPKHADRDEVAFAPTDELVFDQDWLRGLQSGAGRDAPSCVRPREAATGSDDAEILFDQQVDALADMLCATAAPMFKSRRTDSARGL